MARRGSMKGGGGSSNSSGRMLTPLAGFRARPRTLLSLTFVALLIARRGRWSSLSTLGARLELAALCGRCREERLPLAHPQTHRVRIASPTLRDWTTRFSRLVSALGPNPGPTAASEPNILSQSRSHQNTGKRNLRCNLRVGLEESGAELSDCKAWWVCKDSNLGPAD